MEDADDPVDAAAGLLLLRSVGASGMENRGERGSWSRSQPGDREEESEAAAPNDLCEEDLRGAGSSGSLSSLSESLEENTYLQIF